MLFLLFYAVSGFAVAGGVQPPGTFGYGHIQKAPELHAAGGGLASEHGVRETAGEVAQKLAHPNKRGSLLRFGFQEHFRDFFLQTVTSAVLKPSGFFLSVIHPDDDFHYFAQSDIPSRYPIPPPVRSI